MRRHIARLLGLAATCSLAILWLVSAPAASAGDPCYHGFTMPASTTAEETDIKLMPCAFGPTVAQVAVGSTVTFWNGSDFAHLVTGADQAWGSRDRELKPGESVSYTFDKPGIYPYACALHRGMSGTIVVGDIAAANSAGSTGGGSGSATAGASQATPAADGLLGPAALALGAGLVIGAAVVVLAVRRRRTAGEPPSTQAA